MTPATQEGTERAQAGETPSPRVEDDGQRRVLLVEDSAADRALIQRMLRGSEYRDVEASRIADAIAHCVEAGPPDAVLLDLGLPDASGMDAVVAMRRAAPRTPIVVLTGNTLPEAGREAVRSGADDYLVKDALDADRLQRTLSLAIERAQRTQMTERLAVAEGLASLGRLAASVAHDVNNPTTYARANLEIVSRHLEVLRAEHPDARLDDAARLVAEARVGIDHVVSIVADLRALGRISERTPERVDLASVVRTACRLTRNELYHRARVNVEVEEGIGIAAYRTRLLQAISNVLLNAAQSFEAGRASKNTVEVRLRKVGEAVEIAIRDTGRGMPPHLLARAFEPFFTARADGTGLGLALVREIVEEHEGTVRIESEVGIGTTVVMTLPLTNRLVPTALVAAPTPSLTGRRHRVLIVDDDALVRRAMARVLRDHDVVQAGDGEEALTLLEEDADYDVIITDVMMPNVYGPELVATLAQRWPELGPRVVLCTGGTLTPEAEALVGAAPTLIEKPIRAAELIATVERIAARADDP